MLIGRIAEQCGVSRDTVRFYEKEGLLGESVSRRSNGYKEYGERVIARITAIRKLLGLRLRLQEIGTMITNYAARPTSCPEQLPLVRRRIAEINAEIRELQGVRKALTKMISCCPSGCPDTCDLDKTLRTSI